jgi:leucyl/phenylalanyl-tRNA---protein transferase
MIPWLEKDTPFPDVSLALKEQQGAAGLLAAGADLSVERLKSAYQQGIFPWYSDGQPILWWSTDPRMVLMTDDFKISQSLKKKLKHISNDPSWALRFDTTFTQVIHECAKARDGQNGTWISDEMINAYCQLHQEGFAHSSEVWYEGELVGGAYGISIGKMFYGESMFARKTDASKIALAHLVFFLRKHGVTMIDCQQETGHLASLGASPISRALFCHHLATATQAPEILEWCALTRTDFMHQLTLSR